MSDLTLKQVQGDNSAISGVPAGARIEHIRQENKIEVRVGQQLITTFDLAEGVVYLMNSAGKTIDKFETNGAPPKQEQPEDYANSDDLLFTMHGVRYINISNKTYRIPDVVSNFTIEAWDENGRVIGRLQISKWSVMKQIQRLGDLFGNDKVERIKKIWVVGGVKLELQDYVLDSGVNFQKGTVMPHEQKLKEFGATLKLLPDVHLIKNNRVYTSNAAGDMVYHGLLVTGA